MDAQNYFDENGVLFFYKTSDSDHSGAYQSIKEHNHFMVNYDNEQRRP